MEKVLAIAEVTNELVIVKVNANDPLTVARHPYLSSDMEYITVTRGSNHIFTVINKDGKTWDFYFGSNGHTLIGESTALLKNKVMQFIKDNDIIISYCGDTPRKAKVYYNSSYRKWQLTIECCCMCWADESIKTIEEAMNYFSRFVKAKWMHKIAITGIDVWEAIDPVFTLK